MSRGLSAADIAEHGLLGFGLRYFAFADAILIIVSFLFSYNSIANQSEALRTFRVSRSFTEISNC